MPYGERSFLPLADDWSLGALLENTVGPGIDEGTFDVEGDKVGSGLTVGPEMKTGSFDP